MLSCCLKRELSFKAARVRSEMLYMCINSFITTDFNSKTFTIIYSLLKLCLLLHLPFWIFVVIHYEIVFLEKDTCGLWPEKVSSKVVPLLTHHEVRDGRKDEDGEDAVWNEVSKHFRQEVDRGAVETARVLMAEDERNMC